MQLELNPEEYNTLKSALDRVLVIMQGELAHTEAPSLRHALSADCDRVERLRRRLDAK